MKIPFLISVDTEGDGLWWWKPGDPIRTENARYLERFQRLCESYGFKPTYLTNWEMANCREYCSFVSKALEREACEVGMHLHAWNTPPFCEPMGARLPDPGQDYLIEYSEEAMEKKIVNTTKLIERNIGIKPISHRAGRWAMDDRYFKLLARHGYACDCSVTPHIDWSACKGCTEGSRGSDYSKFPEDAYVVNCGNDGNIFEVPLSTIPYGNFIKPDKANPRLFLREARRLHQRRPLQCRPTGSNLGQMAKVLDQTIASGKGYLMFMIHSSELMPGGSPTFPNEASIEALYGSLEVLFALVSENCFGSTIGAYAEGLIEASRLK